MGEVEEDTADEFMDEAAEHMKMELTSQISLVTLKIQSGMQYQRIKGKISPGTHYIQIPRKTKRGASPYPSVMKKITRIS